MKTNFDISLAGWEALQANDISSAKFYANEGLTLDPLAAELWELLGRIAKQEKKYEFSKILFDLAEGFYSRSTKSDLNPEPKSFLIKDDWSDSLSFVNKTEKKLAILFIAEFMVPPLGGAEHTLWFLIKYAAEAGHNVRVITFGKTEYNYSLGKVNLTVLTENKYLMREIQNCRPEIIVSQHDLSIEVGKLAKTNSIPHVLFVQSYELLCGFPLCLPQCFEKATKCQCLSSGFKPAIDTLHEAELIFATSEYVAEVIERISRQKSEIFYQLVDFSTAIPYQYPLPRYITMNQASYHKGIEIFEKLATRFPDETFVTVGYGEEKNNCINNLFHMGQVPRRLMYSFTEILLVPSLWPEPFGRVILESFSAGVPVIASKIGAIPKVTGDAAILIDEPQNISKWESAIVSLILNRKKVADLIGLGKKRLARFDPFKEGDRIMRLIEGIF